MIGRSGERGSGISMLAARLDDDDDIYIYIYTCVCVCVCVFILGKFRNYNLFDKLQS